MSPNDPNAPKATTTHLKVNEIMELTRFIHARDIAGESLKLAENVRRQLMGTLDKLHAILKAGVGEEKNETSGKRAVGPVAEKEGEPVTALSVDPQSPKPIASAVAITPTAVMPVGSKKEENASQASQATETEPTLDSVPRDRKGSDSKPRFNISSRLDTMPPASAEIQEKSERVMAKEPPKPDSAPSEAERPTVSAPPPPRPPKPAEGPDPVSGNLVGSGLMEAPAVITTAEGLKNLLEKLGEANDRNRRSLGQMKIIKNGQLPVADRSVRSFLPWSAIADRIMGDKKIQEAIAQLEKGEDGLPSVMPDIAGGVFIRHVRETGKAMRMDYPFSLNDEQSGFIALDPVHLSGEDDANFLAKINLMKAGHYGEKQLGVVFVDGGQKVPQETLGMTSLQLFQYCEKNGLSLTDPEIYHGMQLVAEDKRQRYDPKIWCCLNGYLRWSKKAVRGQWHPGDRKLYLGVIEPAEVDALMGARRSFRITDRT